MNELGRVEMETIIALQQQLVMQWKPSYWPRHSTKMLGGDGQDKAVNQVKRASCTGS